MNGTGDDDGPDPQRCGLHDGTYCVEWQLGDWEIDRRPAGVIPLGGIADGLPSSGRRGEIQDA